MEAVHYFRGEYQFLSNFYLTPVIYEGFEYPSSENAFQAQKTEDVIIRKAFRSRAVNILSPALAKRYARTLPLRPDWDFVKDQIMLDIVRSKFTNPRLRALLSRTGTKYLFEGNNWHDIYWGVCDGEHGNYNEVKAHPNLAVGENRLGKILERVRFEIWMQNQP